MRQISHVPFIKDILQLNQLLRVIPFQGIHHKSWLFICSGMKSVVIVTCSLLVCICSLCFLYSALGKWRCDLVLWLTLCRGHVVWGNKLFLALLSQLLDLCGSGSSHVCPPQSSGLGLSLRAAVIPSLLKCFFQATVHVSPCVMGPEWHLLIPAPDLLFNSASPYLSIAP